MRIGIYIVNLCCLSIIVNMHTRTCAYFGKGVQAGALQAFVHPTVAPSITVNSVSMTRLSSMV